MLALGVLRVVLLLAAWYVLRGQARAAEAGSRIWNSHAAAVGVLAAGALASLVLVLAGLPAQWAADVFSATTLPACLLVYRGMATYHRLHSATGEVADWLVALSCVLTATAAANLLLQTGVLHSPLTGPALQHRLLTVASVTVVLAVLLRVVRTSRAVDARTTLLLTGSLLSVLLAHVWVTLAVVSPLARTGLSFTWVAFAGALAHTVVRRRNDTTRPLTTSPLSTTTTAFATLLAGVGVITATTLQPGDGRLRWSVVWAVLAVLPVAGRIRQLVRGLVHHDRVQREAATDELTGLPNRRAFTAALETATRERRPATVLLIDLDRFKEVNDRYGHATGDRLLQHVSRAFAGVLPAGALLARLGGDEFAVLLTAAPHAGDPDLSLRTAHHVGTAAEGDPLDGVHQVVASVGVVTTDGLQHLQGEDLLRRADAAMYVAKAGGGGVGVHDDAAARRWRRHEALALGLLDTFSPAAGATTREEFEVHYEPQVTREGWTAGVRASLRWSHPVLGVLDPPEFLGVAEELRLLPELTTHLVTRGCADLARWRAAGHDVRLSFPVDPLQLTDPRLLDLLDAVVAAGTDPRLLVVGTTAAVFADDPESATRTCREIDARGCGLSIDDFGTGWPSLAHLAALPVGEVTVDAALTARLRLDPRVATVVAAAVGFAHHLGLRVVADGVADATTLDLLHGMGCDLTRGPLHGRPVPAGGLHLTLPIPVPRPTPHPVPSALDPTRT
ncbi:diguanylate cyclase (GGDEF)-like protein [Kineococcus radiotolerans]|uniref:Diguanylate cyclase (GGDEF)-like protein n=1 Tax=Kineococcus radiotolerans TaxID=131568 RepID=A0A7W4TLC6_KINRA|nr:EAL domain-containing protein [Kineococcus radiotolerans]MBB2901019.1 diguanylate cyclase (GGDEF)-like protein [Kineococcus radiotolerans]